MVSQFDERQMTDASGSTNGTAVDREPSASGVRARSSHVELAMIDVSLHSLADFTQPLIVFTSVPNSRAIALNSLPLRCNSRASS
jgi:hypothetical protein